MSGKKMEGNEQQRREVARQARREGKQASEVGGSQAASQQRTESDGSSTHQERIDQQREGKQDLIAQNTPEAQPGSRDADTPDRERHPRLDRSVEERGQRRTRGTT